VMCVKGAAAQVNVSSCCTVSYKMLPSIYSKTDIVNTFSGCGLICLTPRATQGRVDHLPYIIDFHKWHTSVLISSNQTQGMQIKNSLCERSCLSPCNEHMK